MTRRSYQQGYVSEAKRTRRGLTFVIRYRLRTADGKWVHKSESLYGLTGKKAARAVLDQRLRDSENRPLEQAELTVQSFVETYWRPYLDRKQVKPSTRRFLRVWTQTPHPAGNESLATRGSLPAARRKLATQEAGEWGGCENRSQRLGALTKRFLVGSG